MAAIDANQTQAVYDHHLQAYLARDLDAIMEDYAEDSVVIVSIAPEPIGGLAAIRGFFTQVMGMMTPELLSTFRIQNQIVAGDIAYVVWSAGAVIPFASDTFVIRDGKIAVQTAAVLMVQTP